MSLLWHFVIERLAVKHVSCTVGDWIINIQAWSISSLRDYGCGSWYLLVHVHGTTNYTLTHHNIVLDWWWTLGQSIIIKLRVSALWMLLEVLQRVLQWLAKEEASERHLLLQVAIHSQMDTLIITHFYLHRKPQVMLKRNIWYPGTDLVSHIQ